MRRMARVAVAALVLAGGSPALAQGEPGPAPAPGPSQDTAHRHLGFFLQMDLGGGYLSTSATSGGATLKLSGGAGQFSIAIGGAVAENLILGGHLWADAVSSPSVTLNGQAAPTSGSATVGVTGIGFNVTYYFMPLNLYVQATPSITRVSLTQGGVTGNTEAGLGVRLAVGKEWWVSDHWGLGLNGHLALSANKDQGSAAPTWGTGSVAVAFSATYN